MQNGDIERIAEQERRLVLPRFDEATAFAIGCLVRDRALRDELRIIIDIQTWDRPLFYAALPGSSGINANWARRKRNVVRLFGKSTYRVKLEKKIDGYLFAPGEGLDAADYVLAGGGFPVTVAGAGVIGVIAVSGLPERDDHGLVVEALCEHLGLDAEALRLPPAAK